ncbi:SMP-30/gluconolactonase/LRE family protein [Shouchella lehensis]|uniref:Gluconolactonase n=1 Tax=Shouchella lehensis G1 TaxID=1246626 RepID=A0A060LVQ8_9BACI|nr:SMP-30/gluconolactonase/LRE family protein [Shouchella lehensis]AIC95346.1 gluconolactonase [Shouchella lehensis G1]
MKINEAKRVWSGKALLGEGPFWDEQEQRLLWVDIEGYKLHAYDTKQDTTETLPFAQHVTAVVKKEQGGLLLAMRDGLYSYYRDRLTLHMRLNEEAVRFNDAKCDPSGRLWAGTMAFDGQSTIGKLVVFDENEAIEEKRSDLTISNGMAWDEQKHLFYHNETVTSETAIFSYDPDDTRTITRVGSVPIDYQEYGGAPDGMTIDSEGKLWIALWGAGAVIRVDPETGYVSERITVPASNTTSCVFGGADYKTLFITTASKDGEEKSGGLFCAKLDCKGTASISYKGQRNGL